MFSFHYRNKNFHRNFTLLVWSFRAKNSILMLSEHILRGYYFNKSAVLEFWQFSARGVKLWKFDEKYHYYAAIPNRTFFLFFFFFYKSDSSNMIQYLFFKFDILIYNILAKICPIIFYSIIKNFNRLFFLSYIKYLNWLLFCSAADVTSIFSQVKWRFHVK